MTININVCNINNSRGVSVISFASLFAYILSFFFEGQTFYSITEGYAGSVKMLLLAAIAFHLLGLVLCGFCVKDISSARRVMIYAGFASALFTLPFFGGVSWLWAPLIAVISFLCGIAVASWGWFLRAYSKPSERLRDCAAVLILSNLVMIFANMAAIYITGMAGLVIAEIALILSALFAVKLPSEEIREVPIEATPSAARPFAALCLLVAVITIDSGLMYQVINPAFDHLSWLTAWYWAIPYIASLAVMRCLPLAANRTKFLYLGLSMITFSFIFFALGGRGVADYIAVNSLMLGACGIFDLFWWSIAADMLDYSDNPARIFGGCLAANVGGVLAGDAIGLALTKYTPAASHVSLFALVVVCLTTALLPFINNRLLSLLKEHTWLYAFSFMTVSERSDAVNIAVKTTPVFRPLTEREEEIVECLISGMTNKKTAEKLGISENTVKFFVKNIYAKYGVSTRASLVAKVIMKR